MSFLSEQVSGYYDQTPEFEWQRWDRHRTEFTVIWRALEAHLPPPPASLLDCGGGPGRYAIELAQRGYRVTLFDLSQGNLAFARQKAAEQGVVLESFEQGTATDLSRFADAEFDAVLLMGPLYHLLEEAERLQALLEARRVLKPGGLLAAVFISRYAAHRDAALKDPLVLMSQTELLESILISGKLSPANPERPGWLAYFAHPDEIAPLLRESSLELKTLLGVEGLVSMIEEKVNMLQGEAWQHWVDLNFQVAPDPSIHGAVGHLLAIAYRPRWQAALALIASRCEAAGLIFRVVGGTSAALHGVPVPVKDIDIECAGADAYLIGSLLNEFVVNPVRWDVSPAYRSHRGLFVVFGIEVEIIGDPQRLEEGRWRSSQCQTEDQLELEGVKVRSSWLEEETLAYIRRQRMERAGLCLGYCDPDRMLALIRGDVCTDVI